jgi:Zn-dependent protease
MLGFLSWSFPLGSLGGVALRVHWTLLMSCLFGAVEAARQGYWSLVLPALVLPALIVAVHAAAVRGATAFTRGRLRQATLWAGGTMLELEQPARPWPVFAVAAAGPLALAGLAAGLRWGLLPSLVEQGLSGAWLVHQAVFTSALLAGLNLLPHGWFDGGRLWRALLWRPLGIRTAASTVTILGIVVGVVALGFGIVATDPLGLITGIFMIIGSVQERRALAEGWDPVLNRDLALIDDGRGWWPRWRSARHAAAQARTERELDEEQATLDTLLAKVSEQGLPALTAAERATLQRISQRQRQRAS